MWSCWPTLAVVRRFVNSLLEIRPSLHITSNLIPEMCRYLILTRDSALLGHTHRQSPENNAKYDTLLFLLHEERQSAQ